MSTWKPELHTKDQVLSYYDQQETPWFNVYAGPRPEPAYLRFDYMGNDKAIGAEKLADALDAILANVNNNNTYLLQVLTKEPKENEKVSNRTKGKRWPATKNITFQLNSTVGIMPYQGNGVGGVVPMQGNNPAIDKLVAQNQRLIELLEERLTPDDQPTEQPQDQQNGQLGAIGALLENPTLQPIVAVLADKLAGWIDGIGKPAQDQRPGPQINGIPGLDGGQLATEERNGQILLHVSKMNAAGMTDSDLAKLAQIAEKKPMQFKMYISMLRTFKI